MRGRESGEWSVVVINKRIREGEDRMKRLRMRDSQTDKPSSFLTFSHYMVSFLSCFIYKLINCTNIPEFKPNYVHMDHLTNIIQTTNTRNAQKQTKINTTSKNSQQSQNRGHTTNN